VRGGAHGSRIEAHHGLLRGDVDRTVHFPSDFPRAKAGQAATFASTCSEIKRQQLPELE